MSNNLKKKSAARRGYALLVVLMLAPLFFMLSATIIERVKVDLHFTNLDRKLKQAYYIAEAGETAALFELSASNYSGSTHDVSGGSITGAARLPITLPHTTIDSDGWSLWQWNPGDTHKSFTGTGITESYRYKVMSVPGTSRWIIDVEGRLGDTVRIIKVEGSTETAFQYALFANDVLSEFTRGQNQTIYGRVHSNGNMYFRPDGSTLTVYSEKVTAAGDMIRFEDAWGRPDRGGTVRINDSSGSLVTMNGLSQGASGIGNAFDSFHDSWLDSGAAGALQKWDGIVLDGSLGSGREETPPVESMLPNGYYHQNAGLVAKRFVLWLGDIRFQFLQQGRGTPGTGQGSGYVGNALSSRRGDLLHDPGEAG